MTEKTILLVEDNPDDEVLTLRALRKNSIDNEVIVVHDGAEALDFLWGTGAYAKKDNHVPAFVLLDLKLPKIDGLELLRRLRSDDRTKVLPVIVLTSSNEEQDILDSYSFGANSYIRKPVEFESFVEAAGRIGRYWLNTNVSPPSPGET